MEPSKATTPTPEISIWIDKYDDVFSEFDSRPYSNRALSDDFLSKIHRMCTTHTSKNIRIKFHVMEDSRNHESEEIITHSMNKHFSHFLSELKAGQQNAVHKGYLFMGLGFILIMTIFFLSNLAVKPDYLSGVILMIEPVGWFTTWTGLDYVFQLSKKEKPSIDFNDRMAHASISFSSLEEMQAASGKQKTIIPLDNQNLRVA